MESIKQFFILLLRRFDSDYCQKCKEDKYIWQPTDEADKSKPQECLKCPICRDIIRTR